MRSRHRRKPDPLLFLAVFVTLGVVLTTTAYGDERSAVQDPTQAASVISAPVAGAASLPLRRVPERLRASFGTLLGDARSWWDTSVEAIGQAAGPGWRLGRSDGAHMRVNLVAPAYAKSSPEAAERAFAGASRADVEDRTLLILSVGSRW